MPVLVLLMFLFQDEDPCIRGTLWSANVEPTSSTVFGVFLRFGCLGGFTREWSLALPFIGIALDGTRTCEIFVLFCCATAVAVSPVKFSPKKTLGL